MSGLCLDCHHNTTMPVAALLPRYAAETPFPEVWRGPEISRFRRAETGRLKSA